MDIYLGRQPILDRDRKTVAYELLYRSGNENAFPDINPEKATARVLHHTFTTLGLDELAQGKKLFINFNRELLLSDLPDISYKNVVIEILEGIRVDALLVDACNRLVRKGFLLALDDFQLDEHTEQLLSLASIIKFDWLADSPEKIEATCARLAKYRFTMLAEKIETEADFHQAIDMGFELFQGYFFARPEIIKGRNLGSSTLSRLEIIKAVNRPETDPEEISSIVARDAALAYKLLKIINSSLYNLRHPVDSIEKAIVLLGLDEIKKWFSVIILSEFKSDAPDALLHMALARGLFTQALAKQGGQEAIADEIFLAGLFSLLDAMLRVPFSDIMEQLPVSDDIRDALVDHKGPLSPYLDLAEAYESSATDRIETILDELGLSSEESSICYMEALIDASLALDR
jgi:EAL and modified HD-GYP domain-containing signal transduction protein